MNEDRKITFVAKNNDRNNKIKTVVIWILVGVIILLIATKPKPEEKVVYRDSQSTETTARAENKQDSKAESQKTFTAKEYTFENGNFTAGIDFEEGVYTITALEGKGTVRSTLSSYDGGIGAMMGANEDEHYKREYKNIKLPKNCELRIEKVKIKLIRAR